jgi:hypothetical protein
MELLNYHDKLRNIRASHDISKQLQQIEFSEKRFLRSVKGYRKIDKNINIDIRQDLKIFFLGEKMRSFIIFTHPQILLGR